jgi:hypothetical protein
MCRATAEFVASHKHFLILLFPGDEPQSWVVEKLKADGANVHAFHGTPFYLEVLPRTRQLHARTASSGLASAYETGLWRNNTSSAVSNLADTAENGSQKIGFLADDSR